MRIDKTINGEKYSFYVQFIPNEFSVNVRYFQSDEWTKCDVSKDMKNVILPKNMFKFNNKEIKTLKLNDRQNISLTAGYASGSVISEQTFSGLTEFSNLYIGIGINLWDMIFYQQDLRYYKDYEAKNK